MKGPFVEMIKTKYCYVHVSIAFTSQRRVYERIEAGRNAKRIEDVKNPLKIMQKHDFKGVQKPFGDTLRNYKK